MTAWNEAIGILALKKLSRGKSLKSTFSARSVAFANVFFSVQPPALQWTETPAGWPLTFDFES
jgi:hypothetical protein